MRIEIFAIHIGIFLLLLLPSVLKGSRFFGIFAGFYLLLVDLSLFQTGLLITTGKTTSSMVTFNNFEYFLILISMFLLSRNAYSFLEHRDRIPFYR